MKQYRGTKVMMKLIGLVRPLSFHMVIAIILGVLGFLCASLIPVFGVMALLKLLGFSFEISISLLLGLMLLFGFLRGILRYGEQAMNHYIAFKLLALLRDRIFGILRQLAPAKLEGKDKGDLIALITSDIELLEVFYAHTISPVVIAILFSSLICLYLLSFHKLLALIGFLAFVTIGLLLPYVIAKLNRNHGLLFRNQAGQLSSFVHDTLRGLFEIMQFDVFEPRMKQMDEKTEELLVLDKKMKEISGFNQALTNTFIWGFDLAMLFCATALFHQGALSFDELVLAVVVLMSSFGSVIALANLSATLQNTFAAGNRILSLLEEEPIVQEITGKDKAEFGMIQVQNLTFAYDREEVLTDFSLEIERNSIIGLQGQSGSGKSTFLKLLMRFWKAEPNQILFHQRELHDINTVDLRNMESYVTQDTYLFHDTILNNLKIAKLNATQEEIEQACKKASVHDFIMSLKDGYETQVAELGDTLSAGEQQRLGVARAFLHDAPLMLLDEPTSNLDSLNEAVILKSLQQARHDKTIVLVSHRLSTMRITDRCYNVENGRMS